MEYAVDWATKKKYAIYNLKTKKVAIIPNSLADFEKWFKKIKPSKLYLEEGGGDSFKLMARKLGHQIYTVPGIRIKKQRETLGLKKDDKIDVLVIAKFAELSPESFRKFEEIDVKISEVAVVYAQLEQSERTKVQESNRLSALGYRLELFDSDEFKEEVLQAQKARFESASNKFKSDQKMIKFLVRRLKQWEFFKPVKGVAERIAAGIIGNVKQAERFESKQQLRSYAGIKQKKGDSNFNHSLKRALYLFAKGVIKANDPKWYPLYLNTKKFYAGKHIDWKPGKVDFYSMKFVERVFLDEYYNYLRNGK